jgi:hypothetical protein
MPTALNCSTTPATVGSVKQKFPCFYAMSDRELKAIILHAMGTGAGLTLAQIMSQSACYATQLASRKDKLVYMAAMIANQLESGKTASQLNAQLKCTCNVPESTIEAAIVWLFCNYYQQTAV